MEIKKLNEMQLAMVACAGNDSDKAFEATLEIISNASKMENALLSVLWCGISPAIRTMAFCKILARIRDPDSLNEISIAASAPPIADTTEMVENILESAGHEDNFLRIMENLIITEKGKCIAEKYFNYSTWSDFIVSVS